MKWEIRNNLFTLKIYLLYNQSWGFIFWVFFQTWNCSSVTSSLSVYTSPIRSLALTFCPVFTFTETSFAYTVKYSPCCTITTWFIPGTEATAITFPLNTDRTSSNRLVWISMPRFSTSTFLSVACACLPKLWDINPCFTGQGSFDLFSAKLAESGPLQG